MRRILGLLAFLGATFSAFAQPDPGGSVVHRPSGARTFSVCQKNCDFTQVCGANCSSTSSDCVSGSAIDTIKYGGNISETAPYKIVLEPGTYTECIAFNDVNDITLHILPGARIVPPVTAATDTNGGVIRIGNDTMSRVNRIKIINDGYVRNDAFGAPEGALSIGPETCSSSGSWDEIRVSGTGSFVGHHDSIHICGASASTSSDLPSIIIEGVNIYSGADTIVKKGAMDAVIRNVYMKSLTNYCETTETDITDAESGTVKGPASTTTFTLDDDAYQGADAYVGRHGRLSDVAGAGTCTAGIDFWITDYSNNRLVTTTALGVTPDATCAYAIDAVAHASEAPCTEKDWTIIRAGASSAGFFKNTGLHFGVLSQATAPDADLLRFHDSTIEVEVNDFGPASSIATNCSGQASIAGILGYDANGDHQTAIMENIKIFVQNNTVLRSSGAQADDACLYPLVGVSMPVTDFEGYALFSGDIRVDNTVDAAATVYGIVAAQATANTLRVPRAYIEINNTAPAYAGVTKTLLQANSATLSTGDITSSAAITTTGTITSLDSTGNPTKTISAGLLSPVAADDPILTKLTQAGITVSAITCLVDPVDSNESVVVTVNECDSTADNCAGLDGATTITCDNDGASDDGTLSNPTLDLNDYISLTIGTVTGTVGRLVVVLTYTENAQ